MSSSLAARLQQRVPFLASPAASPAKSVGNPANSTTLWTNPTTSMHRPLHHRVASFELHDIGDELPDSCDDEFFDARSTAGMSESSFYTAAYAGSSRANSTPGSPASGPSAMLMPSVMRSGNNAQPRTLSKDLGHAGQAGFAALTQVSMQAMLSSPSQQRRSLATDPTSPGNATDTVHAAELGCGSALGCPAGEGNKEGAADAPPLHCHPDVEADELPAVKKARPGFSMGSARLILSPGAIPSPQSGALRATPGSAARRLSALRPLTPVTLGATATGTGWAGPGLVSVVLKTKVDETVALTLNVHNEQVTGQRMMGERLEGVNLAATAFVFGNVQADSVGATAGLAGAGQVEEGASLDATLGVERCIETPGVIPCVPREAAAPSVQGASGLALAGAAQQRPSRDTVEDVEGAPALPPPALGDGMGAMGEGEGLVVGVEEGGGAGEEGGKEVEGAGGSPDSRVKGDQAGKGLRVSLSSHKDQIKGAEGQRGEKGAKGDRELGGLGRLMMAPGAGRALPAHGMRGEVVQVFSVVGETPGADAGRAAWRGEGDPKEQQQQGEEGDGEDLMAPMSMMALGLGEAGAPDSNSNSNTGPGGVRFGATPGAGGVMAMGGRVSPAEAAALACTTLQGVLRILVPAYRGTSGSGGGAAPGPGGEGMGVGERGAGGTPQCLVPLASGGGSLLVRIPEGEAEEAEEGGPASVDMGKEAPGEGAVGEEGPGEGAVREESLTALPSLEECQSPVLSGPGAGGIEAALAALTVSGAEEGEGGPYGRHGRPAAPGGLATPPASLPPPSPSSSLSRLADAAAAGGVGVGASLSAGTGQSVAFMQGSVCKKLLGNAVDRLFASLSVSDSMAAAVPALLGAMAAQQQGTAQGSEEASLDELPTPDAAQNSASRPLSSAPAGKETPAWADKAEEGATAHGASCAPSASGAAVDSVGVGAAAVGDGCTAVRVEAGAAGEARRAGFLGEQEVKAVSGAGGQVAGGCQAGAETEAEAGAEAEMEAEDRVEVTGDGPQGDSLVAATQDSGMAAAVAAEGEGGARAAVVEGDGALVPVARSAAATEGEGALAPVARSAAATEREGAFVPIAAAEGQSGGRGAEAGGAEAPAAGGAASLRKRKADILVLCEGEGGLGGADAPALKRVLGVDVSSFRMTQLLAKGEKASVDEARDELAGERLAEGAEADEGGKQAGERLAEGAEADERARQGEEPGLALGAMKVRVSAPKPVRGEAGGTPGSGRRVAGHAAASAAAQQLLGLAGMGIGTDERLRHEATTASPRGGEVTKGAQVIQEAHATGAAGAAAITPRSPIERVVSVGPADVPWVDEPSKKKAAGNLIKRWFKPCLCPGAKAWQV